MFRVNLLKECLRLINKKFKHTWIQPQGYDTKINVYNCAANDKVPLIVPDKNRVSWYTCGPTVYDSAHIGHASCYVKLDIIQRILKNYFDLNILTVMNITDIDDKIIKKSNEFGVSPSIVAKKYENEFWIDMLDLNVSKPDIIVRVTEHIPIILDFIKKIVDNGSAYIAQDNSIYFNLNTTKENYGKLVPIVPEDCNEHHVDISMKKNKNDFVLWKSTKENEPSWETSYGNGRPGWHSECSALASAIFGNQVDIHAGGMDLKFPHHENEEAISCAHYGNKQWVNYWLHAGQLKLVGKQDKMSKSIGNCIYIREMLNSRNSAGNIFRMACAQSHYKSNMDYSTEVMDTAEANVNKFKNFLNDCDAYACRILPPGDVETSDIITSIANAKTEIELALKDDFNTSRVIQILSEVINVTHKKLRKQNTEKLESNDLNDCAIIKFTENFVRDQLNLLGFSSKFTNEVQSDKNASNILDLVNAFRQSVRIYGLKHKNYELLQYCDSLRDELKMCGIEIKDRGKLSSWNKS